MKIMVGPGSGTALVGLGGAALVGASPDHPLVEALFAMVDSVMPDAARLAGVLASLGVETLPPFAIVLNNESGRTLVARGAIVVTIGHGEQVERVDPTSVATWIERVISSGPVLMTIGDNEQPGGALWAERGIVSADSIRIDGRDATVENTIEPVLDLEEPASTASGIIPDDDVGGLQLPGSVSTDAPISESNAPQNQFARAEVSTPDPAGDEPAAFDFTHLVDHTIYRDSRDAEVYPEEEITNPDADSAADGSDNGEEGVPPPLSEEGLSVTLPPEPTEDHRGLISSVPMHSRDERDDRLEPPTPVQAMASERLGDHDGHTVVRAALTPQNVAAYASNKKDARTVNGVLCPQGHANSPVADRCMLCREKLVDRSVRHVQRPVLGRLRLPTGEVVEVDRPIVIGRKPVATELIGGEVPVPLTIDDDVVTRNHAQILIEDWHILIVDLDSTNQTMITIPGQTPRVIAPHDPCVILPGTEIDLGGFGPIVFEGPR